MPDAITRRAAKLVVVVATAACGYLLLYPLALWYASPAFAGREAAGRVNLRLVRAALLTYRDETGDVFPPKEIIGPCVGGDPEAGKFGLARLARWPSRDSRQVIAFGTAVLPACRRPRFVLWFGGRFGGWSQTTLPERRLVLRADGRIETMPEREFQGLGLGPR